MKMKMREMIDRIEVGGDEAVKMAACVFVMLRRNGLNYPDSLLFIRDSRIRRGLKPYEDAELDALLYESEVYSPITQ